MHMSSFITNCFHVQITSLTVELVQLIVIYKVCIIEINKFTIRIAAMATHDAELMEQ